MNPSNISSKTNYNKWPVVFRCFSISIGIVLVVYSILMLFLMNFSFGIIVTFFLGALFMLIGALDKRLRSVFLWKLFKYVFTAVIVFMLITISVIVCYGRNDNAKQNEDAVIVLGAGINGEAVTPQLAGRLNAAIEYLASNTSAIVIVSGGQGPQESITEALAMERFLVENGIAPERIIKEEISLSTFTNLENSKKILDALFLGKEYKTVIVTSDYHIYRANEMSKQVGLDAVHLHSKTVWYEMPVSFLREFFAVIKYWFVKS